MVHDICPKDEQTILYDLKFEISLKILLISSTNQDHRFYDH